MTHEEQLAYVAGFFDGEGSIYTTMKKGKYAYAQISITQTNRDVLDHIITVLGYGKVYGPYAPSNGLSKKDKYVIRIGRTSSVIAVLLALRPYVIVRAARVDDVLLHLGHVTDG